MRCLRVLVKEEKNISHRCRQILYRCRQVFVPATFGCRHHPTVAGSACSGLAIKRPERTHSISPCGGATRRERGRHWGSRTTGRYLLGAMDDKRSNGCGCHRHASSVSARAARAALPTKEKRKQQPTLEERNFVFAPLAVTTFGSPSKHGQALSGGRHRLLC